MNMTCFLTLIFAQLISFSLMAAPAVEPKVEGASVPSAEELKNQPMGFKDWKQKRVFSARATLDTFKAPKDLPAEPEKKPEETDPKNVEKSGELNELSGANVQENVDEKKEEAKKPEPMTAEMKAQSEKLRQLEFNLEIAQGLTIHDYFALYLKNKTKKEMAEAIQKLSPDELSELLMAYKSSLYGAPAKSKTAAGKINQNL